LNDISHIWYFQKRKVKLNKITTIKQEQVEMTDIYSDIIDNRKRNLKDEINDKLEGSCSVKFAVGYLYLSGFYQIADKIGDLTEAKILTGSSLNRETIEELAESLPDREILERETSARKFQRRDEKINFVKNVGESLERHIQSLPHSLDKEKKLVKLSELIKTGKVKIKLYTRHPLHAKAYVFKYKKNIASASASEGIGIVGSSNLTMSGFYHNTELNTYVRGQKNYEELNEWFDKLWEEAVDFEEVISYKIEESWALKTVNPYDIYIMTLYYLVKENLEKQVQTIWNWEGMPPLYSFQRVAIMQAYEWLNKFGGVFISDVVGLGKTYIGAGLLKQLDKRAVIISPTHQVKMWEDFCEKFCIDGKVISRGMLYHGIYNEESVLKGYENRDVVLIDESHHFRNNDTKKYQELQPFLANKKVILITATPQNTSVWNIYNQIKLFHQDEENIFTPDDPHLRNLFKKAESKDYDIRELLKNILIRRTRAHIKKYYQGQDDIKIEFPERKLETLTYNINKTYSNLYSEILNLIKSLTYARYNLWKYLRPDKKKSKKYADLKKVIATLRIFHKINLFKRLESSIYAFKKSISNLLNIHKKFLIIINENNIIPAGEKIQDRLYRYGLEEIRDDIEDLAGDYRAEDFDIEKLKQDISHDINVFEKISFKMKALSPESDEKLILLKEKIRYIIETEKREKVLLFSEYADTIDYLYDNLKDEFDNVSYAHSKVDNLLNRIKKFAPISNYYSGDGKIDIMVSTDVLSEGQNLQDCDVMINYDLHWNPVRLIQRAGRIDRIGSSAETILIKNFLPVEEVEAQINILRILRARISEIHEYIGEDSKILTEDESLNEESLYSIYDKRDIEELEDDGISEFTYDEAENIIRHLEKNNPEYMSVIKKLQKSLRSAKKADSHSGTYGFFRKGRFPGLFIKKHNGEIIENFTEIINEIKCKRETTEEIVSEEQKEVYFQDLNYLKKYFKNMTDKDKSKTKIHSEIRKCKNRLRLLAKSTSDSEMLSNINKINSVLDAYFPYHLIGEIKRLNKLEKNNKEYFKELSRIYNREKLGEKKTDTEIIEKEDPIEFICGEILL